MNGIHEVTGSIPVWSTNFLSFGGKDWKPPRLSAMCLSSSSVDVDGATQPRPDGACRLTN